VKKKKLSEQYSSQFDANSARNCLFLLHDLEYALDELQICFIYNPIQKRIYLKALYDAWKAFDGKELKWKNQQAFPYRRAIRYQYEASMETLPNHQIKAIFGDTNPLENLELIDKISETNQDEEMI